MGKRYRGEIVADIELDETTLLKIYENYHPYRDKGEPVYHYDRVYLRTPFDDSTSRLIEILSTRH